MAQRTNTNRQNNTNRQSATKQNSRTLQNDFEHSAVIHITGTLKEVYVGKKFAYAKIECYNNGDYYTLFRVAFPLVYDFPENGDDIEVYAKITSYKNEYSFTALDDGDFEPF